MQLGLPLQRSAVKVMAVPKYSQMFERFKAFVDAYAEASTNLDTEEDALFLMHAELQGIFLYLTAAEPNWVKAAQAYYAEKLEARQ